MLSLFVTTNVWKWPRGLRLGSATAHLLSLWVRILPRTWMFVCCKCCVLSGRGLCDGLITRPEESYRLWCVQWVWSRNLKNEEALARVGLQRRRKKMFGRFVLPPPPILVVIGCKPELATHPMWTIYIMLLDRVWLKQTAEESRLLKQHENEANCVI
jgi:hypothetical protein